MRLGEMLIKGKIITDKQLESALQEQSRLGVGRLGYHLVGMGFVKERELLTFLGRQYKLPIIDLGEAEIPPAVTELIPKDIAVKYQIVPVKHSGRKLFVAISNPYDKVALDELKSMTGMDVVEPVVAVESSIKKAIDKYYNNADSLADLMKLADDDFDLGASDKADKFNQKVNDKVDDFDLTAIDKMDDFETVTLDGISWASSGTIEAIVRLLVKKRIITEKEILDQIQKKSR